MSTIRNLEYIRNKDARLYEAISDLLAQHNTLAQQVNGNGVASPTPPPAVSGIDVTAQNGHFNVQIQDQGNVYRGVKYFVEHADNPHFTNPTVVHLGDSRSWDKFLGNSTRYFRAYSSYASSPAGPAVYHGGAQNPRPVVGGGAIPGPPSQPSQGSGTGAPGEGLVGPGRTPFRSLTGVPPVRGDS